MYRRVSGGWVKYLDFMLLDLCCLQCSFVLAYWVRHGFHNPYEVALYQHMGFFLIAVDALLLVMSSAFNDVRVRGFWKEFVSCFKCMMWITLATALYLFAIKGGQAYSRLIMILTGAFYLVLSYTGRCIWKKIIRTRRETHAKDSMLVAADSGEMEAVLEKVKEYAFHLPRVNGLILLDREEGAVSEQIAGIPVVADRETMENYICGSWVDELLVVCVDSDGSLRAQLDRIAAAGVVVHRAIDLSVPNSGRTQLVENYAGYTVMTDSVKVVSLREMLFKRFIDIVGSLMGCLICGVALLIAGPMIYIQSPGPIIFKQKRVGRNGKIFTMYKMRSMVMDAEQRKQELMKQNRVSDGMMFKLDFDPRIIGAKQLPDGSIKKGIGNFIRDWSIDELPQFWNVLKGDMSLVGTRPPTLDEWQKYQLQHRARMAFRPGITGLWQVSGRSQITDFDDVVKLDMRYISGWDIGLDFRILLQTIKVVLGRKGAM